MSFIALMLRINGCLRQPFQALRALSDNRKRVSGGVLNVDRQPKHQLQGSGCAADRASRSDDETGGEPADRACSNLTIPLLFHKPLKLTLYRPSQTGGNTKDLQSNFHRRIAFFAQLSFPERKRVLPQSTYLTAAASHCTHPAGPACCQSTPAFPRWSHAAWSRWR